MSQPPDDGRTAISRGMAWASQISNLGLELALPILAGYWLDQRWQTKPWLLIAGALLGISVFSLSVFRLSKAAAKKSQ